MLRLSQPFAASQPAAGLPVAQPFRAARSHSMNNTTNEKVLFWASFFTLIAAGMGFSIRGDILADWGREFGCTQTELGEITGMSLVGFGVTIICFTFFADQIG